MNYRKIIEHLPNDKIVKLSERLYFLGLTEKIRLTVEEINEIILRNVKNTETKKEIDESIIDILFYTYHFVSSSNKKILYQENQLLIIKEFKGTNHFFCKTTFQDGNKIKEEWESEVEIPFFELLPLTLKGKLGYGKFPKKSEIIELERFLKNYVKEKNRNYNLVNVTWGDEIGIELMINEKPEYRFYATIKEKKIKSIGMYPIGAEYKEILDVNEIKQFIFSHPKVRLEFITS